VQPFDPEDDPAGLPSHDSGPIPLVMSWSGGKDSALALHALLNDPFYEVRALFTSVSEQYRRVSHHGVREELLEAQARSIGLPLVKLMIPAGEGTPCTNEVYEGLMAQIMDGFKAQGIITVGFGDLYLEDLRAWREQNLARAGMKGVFPIWKQDTHALPRQILELGFRAILTCVEGKVGAGFAGRDYDLSLIQDLPEGVDPCGENGEFHTFVYDGPCFKAPVPVERGAIVCRDGRFYADLVPGAGAVESPITALAIPPIAALS